MAYLKFLFWHSAETHEDRSQSR